jgi:dienelactone hydrolase
MPNRTLRFLRALALLTACVLALQLDSAGDRRTVTPGGLALIEQDMRIFGPENRYTIATHVMRPQIPGRLGAVILNHGAGATARERHDESPELMRAAALQFAERGYAVFLPLRSGFGATGGPLGEYVGACESPNYLRGMTAAADDVMAVYAFVRRLPYIDDSRIILAGQSAGALAALVAAAREPPGLAAVLAFAAGMGGDPRAHPGTPCAPDALAELFSHMGRQVRAPVLLHYAQNDRFFGATSSRLWYERFHDAGAPAEYALLPGFGADGHFIFTDVGGARYWLPVVEAFLRRHGLPFAPLVGA